MSKYGQKVWIFLFVWILSCLIAGCGGRNRDPVVQSTESASKENLNFRITWKTYSGRGEAIGKIVEGFNKSDQTDYRITLVDGDEDLAAIESLLCNTVSSVQSDTTVSADTIDVYMLPYRYVQYLG